MTHSNTLSSNNSFITNQLNLKIMNNLKHIYYNNNYSININENMIDFHNNYLTLSLYLRYDWNYLLTSSETANSTEYDDKVKWNTQSNTTTVQPRLGDIILGTSIIDLSLLNYSHYSINGWYDIFDSTKQNIGQIKLMVKIKTSENENDDLKENDNEMKVAEAETEDESEDINFDVDMSQELQTLISTLETTKQNLLFHTNEPIRQLESQSQWNDNISRSSLNEDDYSEELIDSSISLLNYSPTKSIGSVFLTELLSESDLSQSINHNLQTELLIDAETDMNMDMNIESSSEDTDNVLFCDDIEVSTEVDEDESTKNSIELSTGRLNSKSIEETNNLNEFSIEKIHEITEEPISEQFKGLNEESQSLLVDNFPDDLTLKSNDVIPSTNSSQSKVTAYEFINSKVSDSICSFTKVSQIELELELESQHDPNQNLFESSDITKTIENENTLNLLNYPINEVLNYDKEIHLNDTSSLSIPENISHSLLTSKQSESFDFFKNEQSKSSNILEEINDNESLNGSIVDLSQTILPTITVSNYDNRIFTDEKCFDENESQHSISLNFQAFSKEEVEVNIENSNELQSEVSLESEILSEISNETPLTKKINRLVNEAIRKQFPVKSLSPERIYLPHQTEFTRNNYTKNNIEVVSTMNENMESINQQNMTNINKSINTNQTIFIPNLSKLRQQALLRSNLTSMSSKPEIIIKQRKFVEQETERIMNIMSNKLTKL